MSREHNVNIFITGGSGFIGGHLVKALHPENDVVIYDKKNDDDILDINDLTFAMRDSDIVIHCAAIAGIYSVDRDAHRTMQTNLIGTNNALQAAKVNGAKLFINFSTSEVYGPHIYNGSEQDMTTQGSIAESRWLYSVSKLAGEYLAKSYDIPTVSVRPFNVFGPGQIGEGAIMGMVKRAILGEPITVYNDGTQIRSWCYIDDFVDAILLILARQTMFNGNQLFNIGNPQNTITVLNLARLIIKMTDSQSKIKFAPHPGPEVNVRVPSIDHAKACLGFMPTVTLEGGLEATIEYYRDEL